MTVLLVALDDLGGQASKREVERRIEARDYLNLPPDLLDSYQGKSEAKWKTRLAYVRMDGIRKGLLEQPTQHDFWKITAKGLERLTRLQEQFRSGSLTFTRWTPTPALRQKLSP